jgi:transcriptional regulator with XRE-family HTH domain
MNPYINRYIGGRLREVRLFRGLSQQTLAERAGISQPQLSKIERNVSAPRYSTIYRLADALGVTPEWLLGLEDYDFRSLGPRPLCYHHTPRVGQGSFPSL